MAYSNFTLSKVKSEFGILTDETKDLFSTRVPVAPSELLTLTLRDHLQALSILRKRVLS